MAEKNIVEWEDEQPAVKDTDPRWLYRRDGDGIATPRKESADAESAVLLVIAMVMLAVVIFVSFGGAVFNG